MKGHSWPHAHIISSIKGAHCYPVRAKACTASSTLFFIIYRQPLLEAKYRELYK